MGTTGTDARSEGIRRGLEVARGQFDEHTIKRQTTGDKAATAVAKASQGCDQRFRVYKKYGETLWRPKESCDPTRRRNFARNLQRQLSELLTQLQDGFDYGLD